ncbi:MAG: hybrid sensor histidine kinase/response regulator, partial [Paludibacter sp.]|nr:hybrid sensor histidine kinase/response regulator [Paludibacter sp.]
MKHHIVILLFVAAGWVFAVAQPLVQIEYFSTNSGLSQGIVNDVWQDKRGFLWLITWNGLNKFDGYSFKNYKAFSGDDCTLSTNRFISIRETRYGDIWCKTYDGRAYLFDVQAEKFIDVLLTYEKSLQKTFEISAFYVLPKGITWLVSAQGYAFRIDDNACKTGEGIELYSVFNRNLKCDNINAIFQDSDGDEWILTAEGINVIGNKQINSDFPFQMFCETGGEIYLVSKTGKMAHYERKSNALKFIDLPADINEIRYFSSISAGNDSLGIATDEGFIVYNIKTQIFSIFDIRAKEQLSKAAHSFYRDKFGDIWIFNNSRGIVRLNLQTGKTQHFTSPKSSIFFERESRHIFFETADATQWMVPEGGYLCWFDRETEMLKPYYSENDNPLTFFAPFIRNYYTDNQGNIWLMNARGITKISSFNRGFELEDIDNGFEIRGLFLDCERQLWVATKRGVIRIYRPDGSLRGYLDRNGNIVSGKTEFGRSVYCFFEDKEKNIWLGTKNDGLFILKQKGKNSFSLQQFVHNQADEYSISNNGVYSIFEDSKGRVWLGAFGGGLNLLQRTEGDKFLFFHCGNRMRNFPVTNALKVRYITEKNGVMLVGTTNGLLTFSADFQQPEEIKFYRNSRIPALPNTLSSNDVMHIYTDSRGDIYLATFTGGVSKIISRNLLTENIEFKNYSTHDGLSSDLALSIIEDEERQLWIVTENALSMFRPENESFENYSNKFLLHDLNFSEAT